MKHVIGLAVVALVALLVAGCGAFVRGAVSSSTDVDWYRQDSLDNSTYYLHWFDDYGASGDLSRVEPYSTSSGGYYRAVNTSPSIPTNGSITENGGESSTFLSADEIEFWSYSPSTSRTVLPISLSASEENWD